MKKANKILLTAVFLMMFAFILSSCSDPNEETDPNSVKDPEKIESADSDPIKEQPPLTEIPIDANLEAAYEAVCNYAPYRMTNITDAEYTVYRTSKITFDDLDPEYVFGLAYGVLPERERETTIETLGKYSPYGYSDGNIILGAYSPDFDYFQELPPDDVEYTVYSTDEFDKAIKTLFGDDAAVEYQAFSAADGNCLVYDGTDFKGWKTTNADAYSGFSDYSVLLYAETDGEFVYVTDKFMSFDYGYNKDGYFIVNAIYSDGAQTDLICSGNDVPNNYRVTQPGLDWGHYNYSAFLFNGQFPGLVTFGEFMQTYKHTFKLADDGTYYWISSEPVEEPKPIEKPDSEPDNESDSNKEQLPLTEIPFEGNLEAAYESICNYKPCRMSFYTEPEFSVYRPSKITFDDLTPEYYFSLAYDIIPEREREVIVKDAGIYSDSAYISGEYIKKNIEYTVYTTDEIEKAMKTLFGEDVYWEHRTFYTTRPYNLVYDGKKYLSYNSNRDGDPCITDYSVVLKAETDGEFVYVTDKFASFDFDYDNSECIVSAIYSDGGMTDLICSGDDVPYEYRTPGLFEDSPVNNLLWRDSLDLEVFGELMQTYKHTFKLAEDGTYYWVSSEPIEE